MPYVLCGWHLTPLPRQLEDSMFALSQWTQEQDAALVQLIADMKLVAEGSESVEMPASIVVPLEALRMPAMIGIRYPTLASVRNKEVPWRSLTCAGGRNHWMKSGCV